MGIANQIVQRPAASQPKPVLPKIPAPDRTAIGNAPTGIQPSVGAKRGPKPSGSAKKLLTLRLDPDVIEAYKSSGAGWQARMNADLRKAVNL